MSRRYLENLYHINADSAVHNLTTCEPLYIGKDHFEEANLRADSELDLDAHKLCVRFSHPQHESFISSQQIGLEARPCGFGGQRWYWMCPDCNKPTMNLYLCPYSRGFYCRVCLNLSYSSQSNSYHVPKGVRLIPSLFYPLLRLKAWEEGIERRYHYRRARRERFLAGTDRHETR